MRVYIRRLESSDVGIESNRLSHSYCIRAVDSSFSDSFYHINYEREREHKT